MTQSQGNGDGSGAIAHATALLRIGWGLDVICPRDCNVGTNGQLFRHLPLAAAIARDA
jgi:hypothetical protein